MSRVEKKRGFSKITNYILTLSYTKSAYKSVSTFWKSSAATTTGRQAVSVKKLRKKGENLDLLVSVPVPGNN